ncbi:MAG: glutathione S-transferase family protein [Caldimonas sp.]
MLELYHFPFSTCSQKVRLVLAEKGLDFVSHEVDILSGAQHDPAYVKLNPNRVVPTLVHDGRVLLESTLINQYLDEAFPEPPLLPADPLGRHRARIWTKRLDDKVHGATAVVTFAVGPRNIILQQPAEVREASIAGIPDPVERAARRSVLEHGVEAPEFVEALRKMLVLLEQIEEALRARPQGWLTGPAYGLADAALLPYVLRLDHLGLTALVAAPARPRLAEWYARSCARPSFQTAVAAWIPDGVVEIMRFGGEAAWPTVEEASQRLAAAGNAA